jgi:hypothetical protein
MNILGRSGDSGSREKALEQETDVLRNKLERNLSTLQGRLRRGAPLLGLGALVLAGVVGTALAVRSSRRRVRSRMSRHKLKKLLTGISHVAGEPQRLSHSGSLRQRVLWAAAAMGASAAARRFARKALVP